MTQTEKDDDPGLNSAFLEGLERFRQEDFAKAVMCFRRADNTAGRNDVHIHKYTSYHGLAMICLGDRSGINLCRRAVQNERYDGEVYYNLALAEFSLRNRQRAVAALQRGLTIDATHPALLDLRQRLGVRRNPAIAFLDRDHFLNKLIGKMTYQKKRRTARSVR